MKRTIRCQWTYQVTFDVEAETGKQALDISCHIASTMAQNTQKLEGRQITEGVTLRRVMLVGGQAQEGNRK